MDSTVIYLDTYVLQQDMRIRLPKAILANLGAEKGVSKFDVYLDTKKQRTNLKAQQRRGGKVSICDLLETRPSY